MKVNIGDIVRFLSEEGGGKVTRIAGGLVYVQDEDGFEIPVAASEVVVVPSSNKAEQAAEYNYRHTTKSGKAAPKQVELPEGSSWRVRVAADEATQDDEEDEIVIPKPVGKPSEKKEEAQTTQRYTFDADAADDANPRFFLALMRQDGGNSGGVDLYVVNDSNCYATYCIELIDSKKRAILMNTGTVEPNTKEKIDSMNPQQADGQTWRVKLFLFKRGRAYDPMSPIETDVHPKGAKLMRDSSFVSNDYFDEKAYLMPIIKDELTKSIEKLTEEGLKTAAENGRTTTQGDKKERPNTQGIIEVDLHIEELLSNTAGMSNKDMLDVQLKHVRNVMDDNKSHKGQRIVFIHGVGQGVLKNEVRRLLDRVYPGCPYQDASFKEYGFGATMVTIR